MPARIYLFLCLSSLSPDVFKSFCLSNACGDSLVFMPVGPQSLSLFQWLGPQSACFIRVCSLKIPHIFRIYSAYNPHISPPDFDRWPIRTPHFLQCLPEFTGFLFAFQVSFLISIKGVSLMDACRNSFVFITLRCHS